MWEVVSFFVSLLNFSHQGYGTHIVTKYLLLRKKLYCVKIIQCVTMVTDGAGSKWPPVHKGIGAAP